MARKKHLISVHTSTGTTAPTGASLYLGEIAVQHTPNDPGLWIKMGTSESSTEYEKFIGKTEITNLINQSNILGSGYTYSGLPYVNSATTLADAYSALTKELLDDEVVTAAALNSLNDRLLEVSAATGDNTEILEYVQENEEVVAGALNGLNERIGTVETHMTGDNIPITGYMTAIGSTEEELTLNEEDTVNEALGKLQKQMLDNEEAIAAGINDLNARLENVDELIAHNTGVTQLSGAVRTLSAATEAGFDEMYQYVNDGLNEKANNSALDALSAGTVHDIAAVSAKTAGILTVNVNGTEQGKYCPSASTSIDLEIIQEVTGADVLLTGYALATGSTEEELVVLASDTVNEAFGKIQKQNYDNEAVVAGALNDLDERVAVLEASSGSSGFDGLEEITWSELKTLRDSSGLTPGKQYRITDYNTTTSQQNTQAAGHQFDIIVVADSANKLNENARAVLHNGDTYFTSATLEAWELKYDIDNDATKYAWADTSAAGRGVIYYMKDEWNNECPYDFKNIQFKVGAKTQPGTIADVFYYTFSLATGTNDATVTDHSLNGAYCFGNKMGVYINSSKQTLPFNVFRNTSATSACNSNTFGYNCQSNTFGDGCYTNTFGNGCRNNTFGNGCQSNTFGNGCYANTFGNNCGSNTFGNGCYTNTFGDNCSSNTFGNICQSNTFETVCCFNIFGNNCLFNTFGNSSYYNSFGNHCQQIIFNKDYVHNVIVENGNSYITLTSTGTTSSSLPLRNITIAQGVNNGTAESSRKTISHDTLNDTFKTTYQSANSQVINI